MENFKDYLDAKLSKKTFYEQYYGECSVCPLTVEIVKHIEESERTATEIAHQCGVDEVVFENLKDADDCCVDSVRKLAEFFKLPLPDHCLKEKGNH